MVTTFFSWRRALGASCLLAFSAGPAGAQYNNCVPPTGQGGPVQQVDTLRGSLMLVVYALTGPRGGRIASGTLDLYPATAEQRDRGIVLVGTTTLALGQVGARASGSLQARDPAAPGVTFERAAGGPYTITLGSVRRRAADGRWETPVMRLELVESTARGYRGRWRSSGPTGDLASGYFCASRF